MSSCISHTIHRVVMWKIIICASWVAGIKCKFQNLHSRKTTLADHLTDRICHITKIFGNNLLPSKCLLHFAEQINSRTFLPMSSDRILCSMRNGKVFIKSSEMIDSDNIIHLEYIMQSWNPPCISCLSMIVPTVQRISPQLSCRRESIRRASGYSCRNIFLI